MSKTKSKLRETGIENLKIMPDPNDTILYLQGGKWYSWMCIIQLTDDERDQLVEVLQNLKAEKDARKAKLKKAAMKPEQEEPRFDTAKVLKQAQEKASVTTTPETPVNVPALEKKKTDRPPPK
jgi:hypothetical protein